MELRAAQPREIQPVASSPAGRKRFFLLVRSTMIIAVAGVMIVRSPRGVGATDTLVLAVALFSNLVLRRVSPAALFAWRTQSVVLLVDTAWVSLTLLRAGMGQDFFLFYFIVLFLAALSENLAVLAAGAVILGLACVALGGEAHLAARSLVRLPFFLATATFYGYMIQGGRQERERAAIRDRWAEELEEEVRARTRALQEKSMELQQLNHQLLDANRVRAEFIANMSHELRTPLNSIIGYSDILMEEEAVRNQPDMKIAVQRIATSGRALFQLIENILEYARLERSPAKVLPSRFGLKRLTLQLHALCRDLPRKQGVDVRFGEVPDIELNTDYGRLYSALSNLLLNAIKFTVSGGVEFGARQVNGTVEFCVRDTGIGISEEGLDNLFEPFRQLDGSSTRQFGGVGLGLAVVRRNVELLRGTVDVKSAVGKGTTFRVRVPRDCTDRDAVSSARLGASEKDGD